MLSEQVQKRIMKLPLYPKEHIHNGKNKKDSNYLKMKSNQHKEMSFISEAQAVFLFELVSIFF